MYNIYIHKMKSETIIKKIITQIDANAEAMKNLLIELEESLDKENLKLKEDIGKKIATSFNLDTSQVLKKIIRKKKNGSEVETVDNNNLEAIEDMEDTKDYIPIYKKIIFQDKEYFYDDKPNGVVFEADERNVSKIVGYIDISTKSINFM
jgi:hypothetical protein